MGHAEEAEATLRRALETDPNCLDAMTDLGRLLAEQERFDEAETLFRLAVEADSRDVRSRTLLAWTLQTVDKQADARSVLDAGLALWPDEPSFHVGIGNLFLEAGDIAQALAEFDTALANGPATDEALVGRALALARQGRHCDAVSALDEALRVNPTCHIETEDARATLEKSRAECGRR